MKYQCSVIAEDYKSTSLSLSKIFSIANIQRENSKHDQIPVTSYFIADTLVSKCKI